MSIEFIDMNSNDSGDKISTCRFRSNQKISQRISSCCGDKKSVTAFKCLRRDIFPLNNGICDACTVYESKI